MCHGLKDAQAGVVLGMLLIALIHFVGTVACRAATVWALLRINRERPSKGPWPDSRPRKKRLNANRSCTPTVTWPLVFQSRARLYRDRKSAPPATFSSAFFFSRSVSALLASRGAQSRAACLHVASCLAATCVSLGRASFSSLDLLRRPAISGQLECREWSKSREQRALPNPPAAPGTEIAEPVTPDPMGKLV